MCVCETACWERTKTAERLFISLDHTAQHFHLAGIAGMDTLLPILYWKLILEYKNNVVSGAKQAIFTKVLDARAQWNATTHSALAMVFTHRSTAKN